MFELYEAGGGQVVVRRARRDDTEARTALMQRSLRHHFINTCIYYYCQEFTLQCCVLGGAVLFIFMGAGPAACCLVPAAAAALLAVCVLCNNLAQADTQRQTVCGEMAGWVAEAPPLASPPSRGQCTVRLQDPLSEHAGTTPMQVVGTVSVSRHWEVHRREGWLSALHVHPQWRRRGVGGALVCAAHAWAARGALHAMEAACTDLQPTARAALHANGWRLRHTYRRPVLWSAVTLPVARLVIDLPHV